MRRTVLLRRFGDTIDALMRVMATTHKHCAAPSHFPPHGQMRVLFLLAHGPSVTVKGIAERFSMTSSAATQMVNALVRSGLLARRVDQNDRRQHALALTAKGKKLIVEATTHRHKRMTDTLAPLTDTELAQLLALHTKLVDHWTSVCKTQNP